MKLLTLLKTTFVSLMLTVSVAQASIIVSFDPSATEVSVGDTFTVDVLANTQDIFLDGFSAFDLDFSFDETLATLDNAVTGSLFVQSLFAFGDVAGFEAFLMSVTGTDILLATLTFTANKVGALSLDLSSSSEFSSLFADVGFDSTALDITVNAVSAPATLGLFGLSLLAMAGLRRKA
tara:strand:- start:502 stop:1035 length:534 start_codon:yes stop_codon:yes gene_type:complete